MLENYKDILSIKDLMEILKIGKDTAYRMIHVGGLRSFKLGKAFKVPKRELIKYINSQVSIEEQS